MFRLLLASTLLATAFLPGALGDQSGPALRAKTLSRIRIGPPSQSSRLSYLLQTLSKFKASSSSDRQAVIERHKAEAQRLEAALNTTQDSSVRSSLNLSLVKNEQALRETERVYNNIVEFSDSMTSLLGKSGVATCDTKTCGQFASCTDTTVGPECVCNEGYVGDGQNCNAPADYAVRRLLYEGSGGLATQAADMHVSVFGSNLIAVAFRDTTRNHIGRVVMGNVREAGKTDLAAPEQFTLPGGKAYNPVVVGTDGGRLVFVWRDENRKGAAHIRGCLMGATGVRGATRALTWGTPQSFVKDQAHKIAMVPLANNTVAVVYADKELALPNTEIDYFGNSLLAQVNDQGEMVSIGKFRVFDTAVARLEITKVSPTAFVVAARAGPSTDEMSNSSTSQEAAAVYGEMVNQNFLNYDPVVNLESTAREIWARGVSLIATNTVAYTYQDGANKVIKTGILKINPESTPRMTLVQGPLPVRQGVSNFVSMLSAPYTAASPHTLAYYEVGGKQMTTICSWNDVGQSLSGCQEMAWLNERLTSVSGVHLGGGKSFMVFTPLSGTPMIGVFGLSRK